MVAVSADDRSRTGILLERVRRLRPQHVMQLAGLWAGVTNGSADAQRQRRRNAARLALRVATRRDPEADAAAERRSISARDAVLAALNGTRPADATSIRMAAADAVLAVIDALDAITCQDRLTDAAYGELIRPWRELQAQIRRERTRS